VPDQAAIFRPAPRSMAKPMPKSLSRKGHMKVQPMRMRAKARSLRNADERTMSSCKVTSR